MSKFRITRCLEDLAVTLEVPACFTGASVLSPAPSAPASLVHVSSAHLVSRLKL